MAGSVFKHASPYFFIVLLISVLGPLQFGFHLAELNAPQDVLTCRKKAISTSTRSLPECIPMTDAHFATISSVFTLGGLAGALASGPFCTRRGRLPAMRLTAIFYLVGAGIESVSGAVAPMAIGRLLSGVGAGASTVIVPLYISEVAHPASRGFYGAWTQISINVGILLTQTLGYFLSHGGAWRWIMAAGVIVAAAQSLGLMLVPESPAWRATVKGDVAGAKRILQRIRGSGADLDAETHSWGGGTGSDAVTANDEAPSEEEGLLAEQGAGGGGGGGGGGRGGEDVGSPRHGSADGKHGKHLGFLDVVRHSDTRPAIVAVVGIMFAQQLCGINSIIMYSVSLLADLLPTSSALLTIVISVVNLLMTAGCSPLPDLWGRKQCILVSICGQGISSLILAFSIVFGVKILSAISVLSFVGFFAVGLGPVPFIMASELVGPKAVGATQSWALGANYIATFLVAQFFPMINRALNEHWGGAGWVYFIFFSFAVCFAGFVWLFVPETRGKKDADDVWGRVRRLD